MMMGTYSRWVLSGYSVNRVVTVLHYSWGTSLFMVLVNDGYLTIYTIDIRHGAMSNIFAYTPE